MRIYRVKCDVNNYQSFHLEKPDEWDLETGTFDGRPRSSEWCDPGVYVLHPKLKRGNFFSLGGSVGTFIVDVSTARELGDLLERSGELLPLTHKGEQFYVVNVTECINVLDDENTEWVYGRTTGAKIDIKRYAFHANRLTETPLFKIPETCRAEILTFEGLKAPEDEFKFRVESSGLTGLIFDELWSDST